MSASRDERSEVDGEIVFEQDFDTTLHIGRVGEMTNDELVAFADQCKSKPMIFAKLMSEQSVIEKIKTILDQVEDRALEFIDLETNPDRAGNRGLRFRVNPNYRDGEGSLHPDLAVYPAGTRPPTAAQLTAKKGRVRRHLIQRVLQKMIASLGQISHKRFPKDLDERVRFAVTDSIASVFNNAGVKIPETIGTLVLTALSSMVGEDVDPDELDDEREITITDEVMVKEADRLGKMQTRKVYQERTEKVTGHMYYLMKREQTQDLFLTRAEDEFNIDGNRVKTGELYVDTIIAKVKKELAEVVPMSMVYEREDPEELTTRGFFAKILNELSIENLSKVASRIYKRITVRLFTEKKYNNRGDEYDSNTYVVEAIYVCDDGTDELLKWMYSPELRNFRVSAYINYFGVVPTLIAVLTSTVTQEITQDWAVPAKLSTTIAEIIAESNADEEVRKEFVLRYYRNARKSKDGPLLYEVKELDDGEWGWRARVEPKAVAGPASAAPAASATTKEDDRKFTPIYWRRRAIEPYSSLLNSGQLRSLMSSLERKHRTIPNGRDKTVSPDRLDDSDELYDFVIGSMNPHIESFIDNPTGLPDIITGRAEKARLNGDDIVIANPPRNPDAVETFVKHIHAAYTRPLNPFRGVVICILPTTNEWLDKRAIQMIMRQEITENGISIANPYYGMNMIHTYGAVEGTATTPGFAGVPKPFMPLEKGFTMEIGDNATDPLNIDYGMFVLLPPISTGNRNRGLEPAVNRIIAARPAPSERTVNAERRQGGYGADGRKIQQRDGPPRREQTRDERLLADEDRKATRGRGRGRGRR